MTIRKYLTAAAVVCLGSLPVVIWVVKRWVAPLRQLVAEARRIGALQVPVPVRVKGDDELSVLAAAFNQMARNLYAARLRTQRANAALERKVAMRTAELERVNARLEAEIDDYDRRRHEIFPGPPASQRHTDRYGVAEICTWSENVARQLSVPERAGFREFLTSRGFDLA